MQKTKSFPQSVRGRQGTEMPNDLAELSQLEQKLFVFPN